MYKKLNFHTLLILGAIGLFAQVQLVWADGMFEDEDPAPETIVAPPPPLIEEDRSIENLVTDEDENEEVVDEGPDFWAAISKGMILMESAADGEIAASVDAKRMLGQGDIVYLSSYGTLFSPEQESVVFKTVKPVHHPKTGALLGDLVEVLGVVKISEVGKQVSTAEILRSKGPIYKKDKIASLDYFIPPPPESFVIPQEGAEGTIVALRDNRLNHAQHDVVYIDQGSEEGIVPGDRFVVIHGGERISLSSKTSSGSSTEGVEIPYREVGTIVVLATQRHTATASIINSVEEIESGDTILYLSQRQAALQ